MAPEGILALVRRFLIEVTERNKPLVEHGVITATIALTLDGELAIVASRNIDPGKLSVLLRGAAQSLDEGTLGSAVVSATVSGGSIKSAPGPRCDCPKCVAMRAEILDTNQEAN